MLEDRKLQIQCNDFDRHITIINADLILIKLEDSKIGINSVKTIALHLKDYEVKHCIVLYTSSVTVFAKIEIAKLEEEGKRIELFQYTELMYNITKHMLVPKHIVMTNSEKKELLKTYNITDKQIPKILVSDPVSRYFNTKPGDLFKIVRNSNVTHKSVGFRIVI
tara:strand:+ start:3880 stop:4374 length:495 start_codon:yes stop_codon:yes gene_type:complete